MQLYLFIMGPYIFPRLWLCSRMVIVLLIYNDLVVDEQRIGQRLGQMQKAMVSGRLHVGTNVGASKRAY